MATKRTTTKPNDVADEVVGVESAQPNLFDEALRNFARAQDDLLKAMKVPSGRRVIAAFAVSCVAGTLNGYAVTAIVDVVVTGTLMMSGSAFLSLLIWVLGAVLAVYSSICVCSQTFDYIASGKVDRHIERAKTWFTSLTRRLA